MLTCPRTCLAACVLFLSSKVSHGLVEVDKRGTVAANSFEDIELKNAANTDYRKANDLPEAAAQRAKNLENKFGLGAGSVLVDARFGRVASILPGSAIMPGNGRDNRILRPDNDSSKSPKHLARDAEEAVKGWMKENEEDLDINVSDELFANGNVRTAVHDNGDMIQVHMPRTIGGRRVVGSRASAVIK